MAAEATLQPIRRYAMDGAILFADILLLPHALGRPVKFLEGVGPVLDALETPDELVVPNGWLELLHSVAETVRRVRVDLPSEITLIGFAGAPWTVATYLVEGGTSYDHSRTRAWAYRDPQRFSFLIDRLTETTIDYLTMQIEAGADAVQLFDSWASALTAEGIERWSLSPCLAIATTLRARHPDTPVIVFSRGIGAMTARFAASGAFAGIGLDSSQPLDWAASTLQPYLAIQGNLDPVLLRTGGEPMLASADAICRAFAGGLHIFNLGHGVLPSTSPDHVATLVARIRGES